MLVSVETDSPLDHTENDPDLCDSFRGDVSIACLLPLVPSRRSLCVFQKRKGVLKSPHLVFSFFFLRKTASDVASVPSLFYHLLLCNKTRHLPSKWHKENHIISTALHLGARFLKGHLPPFCACAAIWFLIRRNIFHSWYMWEKFFSIDPMRRVKIVIPILKNCLVNHNPFKRHVLCFVLKTVEKYDVLERWFSKRHVKLQVRSWHSW